MKNMRAQAAAQSFTGNRTGIQTSPELSEELIEGASEAIPSSEGDAQAIADMRAEYIKEGVPIGSLPLDPAQEGQTGEPEVGAATLLDKLSERLAFERMGTRLYEALINKCQVLGEEPAGPSLAQLQEIYEEELAHFFLLQESITELGGDPTVQSPSADVAGVVSAGVVQVITDPRSSVTQCLQAMLTAELSDNEGWDLLINLTRGLGHEDMANEFEKALENEGRHLENVRNWLSAQVMEKANVALP
jgi:ferritin-like protein